MIETTGTRRIGLGIIPAVVLAVVTASSSAAAAPGGGPAATRPAPVAVPPQPPPEFVSSIATQATSVEIALRQMRADAAADRTPDRVRAELPALANQIDAQTDETGNLLDSHPSLQVLDSLADEWQTFERELAGWQKELGHRRDVLGDEVRVVTGDTPKDETGKPVPPAPGKLQQLAAPWVQAQPWVQYMAEHAQSDDMRTRMFEAEGQIDDVTQSIEEARADVRAQLSATYGVLHDVDQQQARVRQVVESVREARDQAWDRLFQRDGDPIWAVHHTAEPAAGAAAAGTAGTGPGGKGRAPGSFTRQRQAVVAYVVRHRVNIGLHVGLIGCLVAVLGVGRRWVNRWAEADPSLKQAMLAFTAPIATALVLSFFAAVWIYPQAPRLFWAGLGLAALVPTVFLLRRVVERRLFVILDALVVSYMVDQVRLVTASFPLVARGLFLAEMLGGALVLLLLIRARRDHVPADVMGWVVHIGVRVWLAVFAGCLVADCIGYVSLAELVGGAALGGGYLAVILYACTRLLTGLLVIVLRSRPLTLLNGVRRHQPLMMRRLSAGVDWMAAAAWAVGVLAMLSARPAVFAAAYWFWHLPINLGSIGFTPSHLLVFVLTIWLSFLVSRFVQFVLDEDVYGHLHLAGGSSYAINRIVHYAVLVAGFYIAMVAAGFPFSQLNLLVTALTVGLGFGLQNVVNNFVSGLILLFERPIKVGDIIQMSDATAGTVAYIGIRASIIRTPDSSEVIVPNGNLISNQLINWTRTTQERGLSIPVAVGADADPQRVMQLLTDVAAAHPAVLTHPRPQALLVKFSADAFSYELRAWTNTAEEWTRVRSDLAVSLHAALVREGIAIKS